MTNTAKKLTILSANLNFYMSNKVQKKTSEKIVEMLLSEEQNPKPTFIALQEVGNRVIYKVEKDGDINFYKDICPVSKPKKVSIEDELRMFKNL